MVKIYYVPIGSETYIPMTTQNIEEHYVRSADLEKSSSEFKKIMSMIQSSDLGRFDGELVRVKISFPDQKDIYIDNHGVVMSDESSVVLSESGLKKVKKMFEKVTRRRQ